jgi:hypothetical protein
VLDPDERKMLDDDEWDWFVEHSRATSTTS